MEMKGFKLVLAAAFLSGTVVAFAAEKTVTQKGKVFSETEIAIKVGDTITFVNDDNVFHNVLSTHSEN
jgi:plastocyanin